MKETADIQKLAASDRARLDHLINQNERDLICFNGRSNSSAEGALSKGVS